MADLIWLIPALPLVGFVILLAAGRRLGEPAAGWVATVLLAASFVVTVGVWLDLLGRDAHDRAVTVTLFEWIPVGGLSVDLAFLADPLSITMALFVTGVGALIHLYSIGYMHGDGDFARFFALLNLFAFFMLVLVLGDNLLVTFLGWEGVGLCSYQLISFWFSDEANAVAGKKAFVTNRIGDWGFLVAMFLTFGAIGSLDYVALNTSAPTLATSTVTAIALLLFVGAVGKSAQLPLYVWLPDAMAGPTPVSALIHAATMVTAGAFLMIRVSPVLAAADPWASDVIAWTGAITALLAATIAIAQNDIKKVLAYSTISQLGYTFLAIGSGAFIGALFHVVTHAFFKALLFLGSGSVIHGMDDEQDMRRMGGLRKYMPITAITFIVGWLAIAGVPPFAGFWSKDEILAFAYADNAALWAVGLVTALLTAFYMSRQVFLVFYGPERWREPAAEGEPDGPPPDHEPHESPWTMTLPLVVLAGGAVLAGLANLPLTDGLKFLEHWMEPVVEEAEATLDLSTVGKWALAIVSILVASVIGIVAAAAVYLRHKGDPRRIERPLFAHGWYINDAYARFVSGPGTALFNAAAWFDRTVIDGAVNGVGVVVRGTGARMRALQTGYVRSYALAIAVGAVLLLVWVVTRANL